MTKLSDPGVEGIVLMMNLVHFVQEGIVMEASMPPIEHEIVEIV